jgi:hypothetical protein
MDLTGVHRGFTNLKTKLVMPEFDQFCFEIQGPVYRRGSAPAPRPPLQKKCGVLLKAGYPTRKHTKTYTYLRTMKVFIVTYPCGEGSVKCLCTRVWETEVHTTRESAEMAAEGRMFVKILETDLQGPSN